MGIREMNFEENTLIQRDDFFSKTAEFISTDDAERFKKNKKNPQMLSKYLDTNNPLVYSFNSLGYRTKEFSSFRENEFILVMGCSYTEGIGLHEEDIWHSYISKEFNLPIMNLGIGGCGPDTVRLNSIQYIKNNYPKPKMTIIQWPGEFRRYFFHHPNRVWCHVPGFLTESNHRGEEIKYDSEWYHNRYLTYSAQQKHDNYVNILSTKLLWESQNIPYLGWAWKDDQPNSYAHLKNFDTRETDEKARDMAHPGPSTQYQCYQKILEDIRKCLKN